MWQAPDLHALADLLADLAPAGLTTDHLDQLEALERVKAAAAAAQVSVVATFADAAVEVERVQMPHNRGRWTYLGTSGDDRVAAGAAYTARGRGGDDVLIGSYDDDVLLGGQGRDRVVGGRGADRCRAETLRGCEFPE